jgi:hypothetical protein
MTEPTATVMRCPGCGMESSETMPADGCVYFWICPGCAVVVTPKPGDCCVFCSYGSARCPPRSRAAQALSGAGEAKEAVLDLRERLLFTGDLDGLELALEIQRRLDAIMPLPAAQHHPVMQKLDALREWVGVLSSPARLEEHGGPAMVRSLLLADCAVLYCYLAGPPDEAGVAGELVE